MNLVLDDVQETLRGEQPAKSNGKGQDINTTADDEGNQSTRSLGLIVARGTLLVLISPRDGSEQIENPFNVADE